MVLPVPSSPRSVTRAGAASLAASSRAKAPVASGEVSVAVSMPSEKAELFGRPAERRLRHDRASRGGDVVGPICESGDFLAQDRELPVVRQGDLLAVLSAGAYGFAMASQYNSRGRPAEIMVDGASATVVRPRETWQDIVAGEPAPGV